jgi:hypothetical protein
LFEKKLIGGSLSIPVMFQVGDSASEDVFWISDSSIAAPAPMVAFSCLAVI